MMNEQMNKFDKLTVVPFEQMLCDEIGAYVHTVATMRFYAKQTHDVTRYVRYNELHENAVNVMTKNYFDNIAQTFEYVVNNY